MCVTRRCCPVWLMWMLLIGTAFAAPSVGLAADPEPVSWLADWRSRSDAQIKEYFEQETTRVESASAAALQDVAAYAKNQETQRKQLAEMLGLDPLPERTDLKVTVTGEIDEPEFIVKNLHYQALPGLYVTANLYLPKKIDKPCPAILYVCGHSSNKKNGISYGNKVGYHHHGIWFAKNGYVCLTIDTIELGEFQGFHHGTYNMGMWWWNSRGYTPAGVEAWNGIRGIDYLQSLPEVDPDKIGITGRSGGGAYSWYIAALDKRVTAAVPVAGITSMRNHIVDGCIAGHCDCMFMVNTYGWDFGQLAALIAPRPLLLTNSDKDTIFPLDGVMDVYWQTEHVYKGLKAVDKLGLAISEGPHKDTQRLQVNAFEWFNRFLKNDDSQALPTDKQFEPEQLRVFQQLPADERTTTIHESFVAAATPSVPASWDDWKTWTSDTLAQLRDKSGVGRLPTQSVAAPEKLPAGNGQPADWTRYRFTPQAPLELTFLEYAPSGGDSRQLTIVLSGDAVTDEALKLLPENSPGILFSPRGLGPHAWTGDTRTQTQLRRRFALLGQSLDATRLHDVCALVQAVRQLPQYTDSEITIQADGELAGLALYVPIVQPGIAKLKLSHLPESHRSGPEFLNVLKLLDIPQAIALAANVCPIELSHTESTLVEYAQTLQSLPGSQLKAVTLTKE